MAALHHPNSFGAWLHRKPHAVVGHDFPGVKEPWGTRARTRLLQVFSTQTDRRTRLSAVRGLQFVRSDRTMAPGHSHPDNAAMRADASRFLTTVAVALGKRRFDVSVSSRELRGLAVGSRQYRVAKDLLSDAVHTERCSGDFVSMVDNDYYLTEEGLAAYAGHDMGFFSLRPDGLSGKTKESAWSFQDSSTVVEQVSGGATYMHKVWDWAVDVVVLRKGWATYIYDPVVFDVGPARTVVVLLLARIVHLPPACLKWFIPDITSFYPQRMSVESQGPFLVGKFGPPADTRVQVMHAGNVGERAAIVKLETFRALGIAAEIPNTDRKVTGFELQPAAVERILRNTGDKVDTAGCYLLSRYFTKHYRPLFLVNYQSKGQSLLEDGVAGAAVAAVPIAGTGCAPTSSHNNEARAIAARVVDVANKREFSSEYKGYAEEFARLVVPIRGKGVPWSMNELRAQQDRPTQRARRLQEEQFLEDTSTKVRTSSFQKRETYAKPGDPRLINQVPTDHTNRLCSYAASIKDHMKGKCGKWYAVGKNPLQMAQGLRGLQRSVGEQLAGGDYSRMDGRTSVGYRQHVLEPIYTRYFGDEYKEELRFLFKREEEAKTRTQRFGVAAEMGGANLSGSGVTTDLNTCDAAFNEYAARRKMGQEPSEAYSKLGMYFGDDSVVDPRVFSMVVAVASELGMKLVAEPVPEGAGEGYVVFLARVYPDIRTSLASHPDVVRSLRKLCTVVAGKSPTKPHVMRLLRLKVEGVLITDELVPVLAAYARSLVRIYNLRSLKGSESEWAACFEQDADYRRKKAVGPYPVKPEDVELLLPSVAAGLGISVEEAILLEGRLNAAASEADLASLATAVAGGELPDWADWVPTVGYDGI
uniref:RNA replicase n=1 Tax=Hubei noda-like virus 20 TaxID=1922976 RepID=A0A1L3KGE6_9VIRU|nr:hypothetical protein 1 [Hubei noda-like virus 20]